MVLLFDTHSDVRIGEITEEEFALMQTWLEAEGTGDDDYYINPDSIALLASKGAPSQLLAVLERAIALNGEADVRGATDDEGA
jgi:hypothetical protein